MDGYLGNGKMQHAGPGYRANCSGTTSESSRDFDTRANSKSLYQVSPARQAPYNSLLDHGKGERPDERDEKTGDTVLEVLHSKHPEARIPDAEQFKAHKNCPDLLEFNIMEEVCCKVARQL